MNLPVAEAGFCAELSVAAGESIMGTAASDTGAFVLLESHAVWAPKAFEQTELPPGVREHVQGWLDAVPGMRPQLIRTPGRDFARGEATVMLATSMPGRQAIVRLPVSQLQDVTAWDGPEILAALRRGEVPAGTELLEQPVVLVCTHGKRDRCCAKWGTPVYDRLAGRDDVQVWQTSHLGGHRFAATMLMLPEGICYGRLNPDEADAAVDAHLRGEVFRLDRLRGRTALSSVAQVAEHLARQETGAMGLAAVRVLEVTESPAGHWRVEVEVEGARRAFDISRNTLSTKAPGSCCKEPEPVRSFQGRPL